MSTEGPNAQNPQDFAGLTPERMVRVNDLCNRFEHAWQAGAPPRLESVLDDLPEADRPAALLQLIPLDADYRRLLRGESPTPDDYVARFPGVDRDWLAAVLSATEELATTFGPYELLGRVGSGGMGTVYRAQHRRMNRVVAVKLLHGWAGADPGRVRRFRREIEAAARLQHTHIITAHDAGEWQTARGPVVPYLATELVDGCDLSRLVRRDGPLPAARAVDYLIQAARGLAHAHRHGVIHRDVKPANLLLDRDDVVKVTDFGLAALVAPVGSADPGASGSATEVTASGIVLGTADYMAPEQAGDPHAADARADIYSLGCTLHFLLTGRPPYPAATPLDCLLAHRERPIPDLAATCPDVPPEVDRLFRAMLAKRPEERPGSMDEVIRQLEAVGTALAPPALAPDPDSAPTPAPAPIASRPSRRRVLTLGGHALTAVGSAFLGWHLRPLVDPPGDGGGAGRPPLLSNPLVNAHAYQGQWATYLKRDVAITNDHGMELVLIPPGTFRMGSDPEEIARWRVDEKNEFLLQCLDSEVAREVTISRPFYLGVTEVTVGQFRQFAATVGFVSSAERSSNGFGLVAGEWIRQAPFCWQDQGEAPLTEEYPVPNLTGEEAVAYCEWLAEDTGAHYRLPTESEWEYACRAGTTGTWSGGPLQTLRSYAWYRDSETPTRPPVAKPVRQKRPNAFGVYDMHGNLSEWCEWDPDPGKLPADIDTRHYMPVRGGKFDDNARHLRSGARFWRKRNSNGQNGVGFRVVCEIAPHDR